MARQRRPKLPNSGAATTSPAKAGVLPAEAPAMFQDVFVTKKNAPPKIERDPAGPYGLSLGTIVRMRTMEGACPEQTREIKLSRYEKEIGDFLHPHIAKHGVLSAADAWELLKSMDRGGRDMPDKTIFNRIRSARGWHSRKVGKGWLWLLPLPANEG